MSRAFQYSDIECDKSDNVHTVPAAVTGSGDRKVFLKQPLDDILSVFYFHNNFISIAPSDELKAVLKELLKYVKAEKLYVGQLWLTTQIGFDGFCLYSEGHVAAFSEDGVVHRLDIRDKDNAKKIKLIFDPPQDVDATSYLNHVKKTQELNLMHLDSQRNIVAQTKQQCEKYKKEIQKKAPQYNIASKALVKVKALSKDLDPEVKELIEIGSKEKFLVVKETAKLIDSYTMQKNIEKDLVRNLSWVESQKASAGKDFKAIQKMLKSGFIEKFGYDKKLGLFWQYPPTDYQWYQDRRHKEDTAQKIFLGRVKVFIQKTGRLGFQFVSYKPGSEVGTYHIHQRDADHQDYCLGQFDAIINQLLASGQIAQLVTVVWNYILSSNPDSRACEPNASIMLVDGPPQVIDDSFEVWRKKNGVKETAAK